MPEDCISNSQDSIKIRKEIINGKDHEVFSVVRAQLLDYPKNVSFGHLNINSLWNKFDSISEHFKWKAEIFLISETKLQSWNKVKELGKTGQDKKTLITASAQFFTAGTKLLILEGRQDTRLYLHSIFIFS